MALISNETLLQRSPSVRRPVSPISSPLWRH